MDILPLLHRERARGFVNLRGSVVRGRIPLREGFLNSMAQTAVGTSGLKSLTLTLSGANCVEINAVVQKGFLTLNVPVTVEIVPDMEMTPSPVMRAQVRVGGAFGFVFDQALAVVKFPGFVRMENRILRVDLGVPLGDAGFGDLVPFLKGVRITGDAGVLWVDFVLEVR